MLCVLGAVIGWADDNWADDIDMKRLDIYEQTCTTQRRMVIVQGVGIFFVVLVDCTATQHYNSTETQIRAYHKERNPILDPLRNTINTLAGGMVLGRCAYSVVYGCDSNVSWYINTHKHHNLTPSTVPSG